MLPCPRASRWNDSAANKSSKLLWGPLCLSVAYTIFTQHPLRHPLQIIACMGHLYGDVLYYATSLVDYYAHGVSYSRPEPYYFWVYYFAMNFIWIVVPAGKPVWVRGWGVSADRNTQGICTRA